jgi:hypothetical protein
MTVITQTHAITTEVYVLFPDGTYGVVHQTASFGDIAVLLAILVSIFLQMVMIWIWITSIRQRY